MTPDRLEEMAKAWLHKWDGILLAGREAEGVAALTALLREGAEAERARAERIVDELEKLHSYRTGGQDEAGMLLREALRRLKASE